MVPNQPSIPESSYNDFRHLLWVARKESQWISKPQRLNTNNHNVCSIRGALCKYFAGFEGWFPIVEERSISDAEVVDFRNERG